MKIKTRITVYMEGYIYPIGERRITAANGLIEQGPLAHRGNISLTESIMKFTISVVFHSSHVINLFPTVVRHHRNSRGRNFQSICTSWKSTGVDDIHRKVQIPDHPADDSPLLVILLPENCHVRLHYVEQFADDSGDSSKKHGTASSADSLLQSLRSDPRLLRRSSGPIFETRHGFPFSGRSMPFVTIVVEIGGAEDSVHSDVREFLEISLKIGGIGVEILGGRELARVDVDGDNREGGLLFH